MSVIIGLLILAFVLFSFEILIPGGVLGVLGAIAVIAACVFAYMDYGSLPAFTLFIISLIVIGLFVAFEFWLIKNTSIGNRVLLTSNTAKTNAQKAEKAAADEALIGQVAQTLTQLTPTGMIEINGKQYEGLSRDGQIAKGETVRIVSRDTFRMVVEKTD